MQKTSGDALIILTTESDARKYAVNNVSPDFAKTFAVGSELYVQPHKIVSVTLVDGTLEVVRQFPSNISYGNGNHAPDTVKKEIYRAEDGKIVLAETLDGKHTPAHIVSERIDF